MLKRNIRAATGVRASTTPASRPAAGRTSGAQSGRAAPTVATPSSAWGTRMLQRVEAEEPGRELHDPQRRRRLVDGDEVGRVGGAEEEGLPALACRPARQPSRRRWPSPSGRGPTGTAARPPTSRRAARAAPTPGRRRRPRHNRRRRPAARGRAGRRPRRRAGERRRSGSNVVGHDSGSSHARTARLGRGRARPGAGRSAAGGDHVGARAARRARRRATACGSERCSASRLAAGHRQAQRRRRRGPASGGAGARRAADAEVSRRLAAVLATAVTSSDEALAALAPTGRRGTSRYSAR